jgi:CheY-like chemotaxis protein
LTSGKAGISILIVEDSEPAIIQLRDILDEKGYHCVVAHDGGEALGMIDRNVPDAIILDLMMPGIDGFAVLKTIRDAELTAHVPVLILTAKHITKEELRFLKRNNIHQLIQKGDVNRNQLLDAIASMVQSDVVKLSRLQSPIQIFEGKPVVLVIEDNPDSMLTMKALLADNYTMLEATDTQTGIELAKTDKPHCILMDIALPGIDGIAAFKVIRNNPDTAHIPVIAVTASAMTTDREAILAHGFDGYIAKPVDARQLYKCLAEVLYGK